MVLTLTVVGETVMSSSPLHLWALLSTEYNGGTLAFLQPREMASVRISG